MLDSGYNFCQAEKYKLRCFGQGIWIPGEIIQLSCFHFQQFNLHHFYWTEFGQMEVVDEKGSHTNTVLDLHWNKKLKGSKCLLYVLKQRWQGTSFGGINSHVPWLVENYVKKDLSCNQLTGEIPFNIVFLQVATLNLSCSSSSGQNPSNHWRFDLYGKIVLYSNILIGNIPSELGNMTRIHYL
ncbi:hypothetical protein C5167_030914 [Papaver somniferum]|nr:hypothetical protein C5167_030914 [Papaver somniferum]